MATSNPTPLRRSKFPASDVRDDFIPKEAYFSREFAELEAKHMWPKVWQVACRLEEIPEVGNYVTYEILNESIIVVRAEEDTIKAYHNVCPHRGTRLVKGTGRAQQIVCRFHGWKFDRHGKNIQVVDRDDWGGCLSEDDLHLQEVQVDFWGGFVFINLDPDCEPLLDYLSPVAERVEKYEFDKMRFHWYKTTKVPANWKLVLEFFNEFYHVQQAHPQLLSFTDDYSHSEGLGKHGRVWFKAEGAIPFKRSPRLRPKEQPDYRQYILEFVERYSNELSGAMVTPNRYNAAQRLRTEVPADAEPGEVVNKWFQFQMEAIAADGSGWPEELTPEYMEASGLDWHIFPNSVFLHGMVDCVLWYRTRPDIDDPESCILDVWSLRRYGEGQAPPLQREYYEKWEDGEWGMIFEQDFVTIPEVQRGMRSQAFQGSRPNPVQERVISNFHRILREYF